MISDGINRACPNSPTSQFKTENCAARSAPFTHKKKGGADLDWKPLWTCFLGSENGQKEEVLGEKSSTLFGDPTWSTLDAFTSKELQTSSPMRAERRKAMETKTQLLRFVGLFLA